MAVGSLLQTYLSRFGVSMERMSGETIGFAAALDAVARVDPAIAQAILGELVDQRTHLKLIASENYASPEVLLAMGNWLSDKYAEGAPGHRLYVAATTSTSSSREPTNLPARCSAPTTRTRSRIAGSTRI